MNGILKINGGNRLIGEITPVSNKNAVVAVLPLCLLTDKDCIYNNLPNSTDVIKIIEMLKKLGAEVNDTDFTKVIINCRRVKSYEVDFELGSTIRASLNFAGPLLARFGKAKIPLPGGCNLGIRSINTHLDSFAKAGVTATTNATHVCFKKSKRSNNIIWQTEASVTATENVLSFLASIDSESNIIDAAAEPHVTQAAKTLQKMGATISGISSNHLKIKGKSNLNGFEFTPDPDFVDITGHIIATALTKGDLTIKGGNRFFMQGIISTLKKFNINIAEQGDDLRVNVNGALELVDYKNNFPLATKELPKLVPKPWPGFPIDCVPAVVTLMCKTNGQLLINNWMYESGLEYADQLKKLGANITIIDPQKIIIKGSNNFKGGDVVAPGIIEGIKSIFLAGLADTVTTVISNTNFLNRRYESLINDYKILGADIKILE